MEHILEQSNQLSTALVREPPRSFNPELDNLCQNWEEANYCRYGNDCVKAHGCRELQEWMLQYQSGTVLCQNQQKSYGDNLIELYLTSESPAHILSENVDGVLLEDLQLNVVIPKNNEYFFNFQLKTTQTIKSVALIDHFEVSDFSLESLTYQNLLNAPRTCTTNNFVNNHQEWHLSVDNTFEPNDYFIELKLYQVEVKFKKCAVFGKFRKTIVFDFGQYPIYVKHMQVDVVPDVVDVRDAQIRNKLDVFLKTHWNATNAIIVPFSDNSQQFNDTLFSKEIEWENSLLEKYQYLNITQNVVIDNRRLTKSNYKQLMHTALYHEEHQRLQIINQLNHKVTLSVVKSYSIPNGGASKFATNGDLFAIMPLDDLLSEDTVYGKLLMRNCFTVLLVRCDQDLSADKIKAYQIQIEEKTKNEIYLKLSTQFITDFRLKDTCTPASVDVFVQFQPSRVSYCEWHYAIDQIHNDHIDHLFPAILDNFKIPWNPKLQFADFDAKLNTLQKEIMIAVTIKNRGVVPIPPIVLQGPFGTGKTYTFAAAIRNLLLEPDQSNRILLCTHSNSAADLYILEYLDPFLEKYKSQLGDKVLLRIYYRHRNINTVPPVVQKYCMMNQRQFVTPSRREILNSKLIITTLSTSIVLSMLGVKNDFFTHIFIDEAAQVMECESLIPISLSNMSTRIILAGDHMQMNQELYSDQAKRCQIHLSLLQRLQKHYPTPYATKIILRENYRSHEAIVHFTSQLFYQNQLIACGDQIKHSVYYPLTFFTAKGEEVLESGSTSYHNDSEIYEIVERIVELRNSWPVSDWGEFKDNSIGVITPYFNQVIRIRSELRRHRLYNVSVERIFNVQGKEFRVVLISTVRTWKTAYKSDDRDYPFFTDHKLLNTAITRARSLVIVVGDPVALCTIGDCRKIWERYIHTCHINKSFFGMTWQILKFTLDYLEFKKPFPLNPAAAEFYPRNYSRISSSAQPSLNSRQPFLNNQPLPVQPSLIVNPPPQIPQFSVGNPQLNEPIFLSQNCAFTVRPHEFTWLHMLHQPLTYQMKWYNMFRETNGVEIANQFLANLMKFKEEDQKRRQMELLQVHMRNLGLSQPLYLRRGSNNNTNITRSFNLQ